MFDTYHKLWRILQDSGFYHQQRVYSQIFSNLILNSLKDAFDGVSGNMIDIGAEIKDTQLLIHYNDNGVGVTKEVEGRIFDPFFTTARGQGGSGLGLNIVYNLIKQKLNGDIQIIHSKRKGLHFTLSIELPKKEKDLNNG